jgi:hypothetical protein
VVQYDTGIILQVALVPGTCTNGATATAYRSSFESNQRSPGPTVVEEGSVNAVGCRCSQVGKFSQKAGFRKTREGTPAYLHGSWGYVQ